MPDHGNVLLWQGAAHAAGVRSLSEYLEDHGSEVRRRYLAWSHELGGTQVMGRPLRERLRVPGAGSLWPLSMFVEQSIWKQTSLEKILKLLALEVLLENERPESLAFCGDDRDLSRVLAALCRERRIVYRGRRRRAPRSAVAWWRRLPSALQGLAAVVHLCVRRGPLPRPQSAGGTPGAKHMLICAPFINHTADAGAARDFRSHYWTELPQLLAREGYQLLWLHLFYPHDRIPTARAAAQVVRRIGRDSEWSGAHGFVEAYFPAWGLPRLLLQWSAVALESLMVGACLRARFTRRPRQSFWPLLRADWAHAFRGIESATALFYLECFDRALAALAHQHEGIYLMENQGWERALCRAWRRHRHGRLTAVAHSTLRFWDLRYHCDPRRYQPAEARHLPGPDVVALNGVQARLEFLATCASREPVVECEALRYLQLGSYAAMRRAERAVGRPPRLLLLGDFLPASTAALLLLLEEALRAPGAATPEIWIKAHPNCPVAGTAIAAVSPRIVTEPVAELATSVDLVVASNTTSAALEAYLCGARVLVYDDRSGVNFSPLRSVPGVSFVHDPLELRAALAAAGEPRRSAEANSAQFFHTDAALPRWRAYLGLGACSPQGPDTARSRHSYQEDLTT